MNAPTAERDSRNRRDARQRRMLVGLAVLFFAPLALSFYLYYGQSSLQPLGKVNRGVLVLPPRQVPAGALPSASTGKWTLVVVSEGACESQCRRRLYDTRQVRTALDRDLPRVQRLLVAVGDCCDQAMLAHDHPDLTVMHAPADAPLLAALKVDATEPAGRIFVIDPLGNFMMWYAADAPAKGLLEDMKRLLKLSHIG
jgi:hypothetical protein